MVIIYSTYIYMENKVLSILTRPTPPSFLMSIIFSIYLLSPPLSLPLLCVQLFHF